MPVELPDGRGMASPAPTASVFGLTGAPAERMNRLGTPQPVATITEPVHMTGARDRIPVRTYIWAEQSPVESPRLQYERLSADPAWRCEKLACNHMTMLEKPEETAEAFLRAAEA
jgi:hypothetical protein